MRQLYNVRNDGETVTNDDDDNATDDEVGNLEMESLIHETFGDDSGSNHRQVLKGGDFSVPVIMDQECDTTADDEEEEQQQQQQPRRRNTTNNNAAAAIRRTWMMVFAGAIMIVLVCCGKTSSSPTTNAATADTTTVANTPGVLPVENTITSRSSSSSSGGEGEDEEEEHSTVTTSSARHHHRRRTADSSAVPPPAPVLPPLSRVIDPSEYPEERPGYKHPAAYTSTAYIPRSKHSRRTTALAKTWGGSWTLPPREPLVDLEPLYQKYPHRNVPFTAFPENAWQRDSAYLKQFLSQSITLCERALKAILAEWGHFKPGVDSLEDAMVDANNTDPAFMFSLMAFDTPGQKYPKASIGHAGYASTVTLQRLRRKLLHAVMTEHTFHITLGGHSSSAGHGNHFSQSYTLQIQKALEPVLARVGVFHQAHNMGMGGMGTAHNSLGTYSIYGSDNAVVMWDSSMTEGDMKPRDMYTRQAILSNELVPVITGDVDAGYYFGTPVQLGRWATGFWSSANAGIAVTESLEQVNTIPYAARFTECSAAMWGECRRYGYNGVCWIDRDDFTPHKQAVNMGGRAKWHPGNGRHLVNSRLVSYNIIKLLWQGLKEWYAQKDYILPDDVWHINDTETMKAALLEEKTTPCYQQGLPSIICEVPLMARTEFTPRANPASTSIRSIIHPTVHITEPPPNVYDPPDVENPALDVPDGEIDYMAIVENGIDFAPLRKRYEYMLKQLNPPKLKQRAIYSKLPPGQGWQTSSVAANDLCDGSYDSFCNRGTDNSCLLYGHNDGRNALYADGLSGWLFMTLSQVKHGLIIVLFSKSGGYGNKKTLGWKCENNAETCSNPLPDEEANHGVTKESTCTDYTIEFSINGVVTTWTSAEFTAQVKTIERLIDLSVLLDDRQFVATHGGRSGGVMDVELGLRVGGTCGRQVTFGLSHVYWA